jgi:hypothetical protein
MWLTSWLILGFQTLNGKFCKFNSCKILYILGVFRNFIKDQTKNKLYFWNTHTQNILMNKRMYGVSCNLIKILI